MRALLGAILILFIALGGYWLLEGEKSSTDLLNATSSTSSIHESQETYISSTYGITFQYPTTYQRAERDAPGSDMRRHHIITLVRTADMPVAQNAEGPPAITIEMFQNNLDNQTTEGWIRNSSFSNFKLSPDGVIASTTLAGEAALSYTWDGLYRGQTIAIAQAKYVYAFSVASEHADSIRDDFVALLSTVEFR